MMYHWSNLVCATWIFLSISDGSVQREDSNVDLLGESDSPLPDSAPEPVLGVAISPNNSSEECDLSESESSSGPELVLSDQFNSSLDAYESESGSEPVMKSHVHGPLEDKYVKYYGNNPWVERCWTPLRDLHSDEDDEQMKNICIEYHKLAKKGSLKLDEVVLVDLNKQLLKFRTRSSYLTTHIDVVWYGVNDTGVREIEALSHFYITRGLGSDCVFYLTPTDKTAMSFYLEEHVCKNTATAQMSNRKKSKTDKKGGVNIKEGKKKKKTSSESVEEEDETSVEEIEKPKINNKNRKKSDNEPNDAGVQQADVREGSNDDEHGESVRKKVVRLKKNKTKETVVKKETKKVGNVGESEPRNSTEKKKAMRKVSGRPTGMEDKTTNENIEKKAGRSGKNETNEHVKSKAEGRKVSKPKTKKS